MDDATNIGMKRTLDFTVDDALTRGPDALKAEGSSVLTEIDVQKTLAERQRNLDGARLPTFFVIGAPRSGTTSLYEYLNAHPDIYMSPIKEPEFFILSSLDEAGAPDAGGTGPAPTSEEAARHRAAQADFAQYAALFSAAGTHKCRGEASVIYLGHPTAAENIRRYVPGAKLIAILRDPAERLYSHHMHAQHIRAEAGRNEGSASLLSDELDRALQRALRGRGLERATTEPEVWVRSGFYARHLERFRSIFPEAQLRVFLFEDLLRDPQKLMTEIFEFLEVDPSFLLPTTAAFNATVVPKNRGLFRFFTTRNPVMRLARRVAPPRIRVLAMQARSRLLGERKPPCDQNLRRTLVGIYREDVGELQRMLKRDLSSWLDDGPSAVGPSP